MSHISDKTTILYKRQRWAEFCQISARYNYEGFSLSQFYGFTELSSKLFFRIITPDESHLGKNDNSAQAPAVGGFLADSRPLQLRGLFAFPILRLYVTFFSELFPESPLPTSRILVKNDNFAQAPTVGGFLPDFRPLQ